MFAEQANTPITVMARLLGVDRQRFYDWQARRDGPPTATDERMGLLVDAVRGFHHASDGTYGSRRILHDLREDGWVVSGKTVAKAMRIAGLEGISPRTWHPPTTTHGDNPDPVEDLVQRQFDMGARDLAWHSDITYLAAGSKWAYMCAVRDGHTRRVLGRTIEPTMTADLVENALRQAVALRGKLPGQVFFHADRGTQFTSKQLAEAARDLGVLRSMGRTGVCWDNAAAESFWSTYKNEYYYRHAFRTFETLQRRSYVWIDSWYNAKRRHSALGYISPLEYERRLLTEDRTH
jgi:transposase InsO family protein